METIADDLDTMVRVPLADDHVAAMRNAGECSWVEAGEWLVEQGEPIDRFWYVESGEIEIVDPASGERYGQATLGPGQYLGEISFLNGGNHMLGARAVCRSRMIGVPRASMFELMSRLPELSDRIITVFAARRRRFLEANDIGLTLIGAEADRDVRQIEALAHRSRLPVRSLAIGDPAAVRLSAMCGVRADQAAVIVGKDQVVTDPTPRKIADLLGLGLNVGRDEVIDVVIVGAGPAGVAAGVYAGAEGLVALVVESLAVGGQAGASSRIENYMGFMTGISGADLVWRGEVQALKFGTRFTLPRRAVSLKQGADKLFSVELEEERSVSARSVIIATGVKYRSLGIPDLDRLEGSGIFYAATDSESRWCRETEVVVIGGGNSAGQAAMFLSRTSDHVHLFVRSTSLALSMSDYLSRRLESDPAITIHYETEMTGVHGKDYLEAIDVVHRPSGKTRQLKTRGVFIMVGAAPNTEWLNGCVELDDKGYVLSGAEVGKSNAYETSHDGIHVVGDVRSGSVKRVASAVGEGSVVISSVWQYVDSLRQS